MFGAGRSRGVFTHVHVQVRAREYAAGECSGFHQWEVRLRRSDSWNVRMISKFGITS